MKLSEYVMLMMVRCDYVEGIQLTVKGGQKMIPIFIWRIWNDILVYFRPGYKEACIQALKYIQKNDPSSFLV